MNDDITKNFHGGADTSDQAFHGTSHEARAAIRSKVFAEIANAGMGGRTCDEVEQIMSLTHQTASARITELAARAQIIDSGVRRLTRSGRNARVYVEAKLWLKTNAPATAEQRRLFD